MVDLSSLMPYSQDVDKALEIIKNENERKDKEIKALREENRKLKEEYNKDEEIQKMQEKLEVMQKDLWRGFSITEEEQRAIDEWKKQHEEEVHGLKTAEDRMKTHGCCGGAYSYHFVPCSLGVSSVIRCHCGAEFEFQEIG